MGQVTLLVQSAVPWWCDHVSSGPFLCSGKGWVSERGLFMAGITPLKVKEWRSVSLTAQAPLAQKKSQWKYISDHLCFSFLPRQVLFLFYPLITSALNGIALTFRFLCRNKKFLFSSSQDLAMVKEGSPSSIHPLLLLGLWIVQVNLCTSLYVLGASSSSSSPPPPPPPHTHTHTHTHCGFVKIPCMHLSLTHLF